METVRISGNRQKRTIERYNDNNGITWIRLKYNDKYRTEVIITEAEFEKVHGKFD